VANRAPVLGALTIVIQEYAPENVGIGGELLADRVKETK
jgi:phenylpyruvate tautomerase PptA (4-oxalocrotonate tautomerase family)